jgi:protein ImuB
MPRLASLCLPDLAIDRIRLAARPPSPPERRAAASGADVLLEARGGGWRPGARGARAPAPTDLAIKGDGDDALVTSRREGNRDLVAAACPAARALGLFPGMPLTKARILVPGLDVRPADDDGDAAWLARLGLFAARRWTPRAALSGADGLWLDLSGGAHLFGGEKRMCERILGFCRRLGFAARIAVAGTAGAAHALARFAAEPLVLCPPGGEAAALAPFPLAALRLDEAVLGIARRLGIERIGELAAMPRAPLQRRFGADLLLRLDQALGKAGEPFDPIVPVEAPAILLRFMEPIATAEAIEEASGEAVRRLMADLARDGLAVRRLVLWCERVDGDVQHIAIGTARATRDGAHLHGVLSARIETIEPGFGIERMRLVAARVEPLGAQPIAGALAGEAPPPDLAPLIDRLAMRLGARRLYRLGAVESDVPERSVRPADPLGEAAAWPDWPRPIRLLAPPEPVEGVMMVLPDGAPMRFAWRGRAYRVAAADGPERLYGEWWKRSGEADALRDYFQIEDDEGRRFWLFRRGDSRDPGATGRNWFLHGIFA